MIATELPHTCLFAVSKPGERPLKILLSRRILSDSLYLALTGADSVFGYGQPVLTGNVGNIHILSEERLCESIIVRYCTKECRELRRLRE